MTDLIIKNATIVTADRAGTVLTGGVAVEDGRITHLGEVPDRAQEVVDARGGIVMPGLVNTHCHAADSLFRGLVENLPLEPWLQTVWKAERAILTAATCRLGARLGFAELLLSGCTSVVDMFWHPHSTARAGAELGLRVSCGGLFFDFPGMDGKTVDTRLPDAEAFFADHPRTDRLRPGTFPHGAYTVGPENLKIAKKLADDHDALFSTHAAETTVEQQTVQDSYGASVIRHMEALGILDARTILAHCVHCDDEEIAILARSGAVVAHNPVSNLKLASGFARIPDMLEAGVHVTLGTDGAISGNDIDMWLALRLAATLHKAASGRADVITTREALHMATLAGAEAMGLGTVTGSLEIGKAADLVVLDTSAPHAVPIFDPLTHIVYSAGRADVRHVFVDGQWRVRDRALTVFDMTETLDEIRALVPAIKESIA
ncbi:5-methylthioadenosine/S-adenosylhomocysteine deaminase [Albimonas donghaensis]|uniref:5-methylthioadenosine/S-adenosylhomocysteine deaminase n=1 Tax=Albimonas donghaensis TaxID=356660 RepID=A0A1H2WJW2_9RHOB|nr:amidohydrolase [Albimonas donghaensis]SDW80943.1 5-methylthioadenosine/S-adenosylhomocysteine deaminase [Albimonas donghaensis]